MSDQITVQPFMPAHLQDYLKFFDHDAFTDNPHWASCYCYFNQAPHHEKDWHERGAAENRAGATGLIERGKLRGYLAYLDGNVIGWCNVNVVSSYTTFDEGDAFPPGDKIAVIACFVVAPPYRKRGVARKLLDAAMQGLTREGMESVYVITQRDTDKDTENLHGPLKIYLDAGFEIVQERPPFVQVRKMLTP